MTKPLATIDELKAELQLSGDKFDAALSQYLLAATAETERLIGRPILRQVDRVEYPRPDRLGAATIRLAMTPIESVASVKISSGSSLAPAGFDDPDNVEQLQEDHFVVDGRAAIGRLDRIDSGTWPFGRMKIQVRYTAGYLSPEDDDPEDPTHLPMAHRVPADLRRAIVTQCVAWHNQRGKAGIDSIQAGQGGSAQLTRPSVLMSLAGRTAHPDLERVCGGLKRYF